MQLRLIALLLIPAVCAAQTAPVAQLAASSSPAPATTARSLLVPAGTSVPLTLISTIKSKSTKPGAPVRAVVAFPVLVSGQLAIPAGTYVEGMVESASVRSSTTHRPSMQIHFTRLLFANGYTVALDAANTESRVNQPHQPGPPADAVAASASVALPAHPIADRMPPGVALMLWPSLPSSLALFAQTTPTPTVPALPSPGGPSPAALAGIGVGVSVAILLTVLAVNHHTRANTDFLLFDEGWQFQMALTSPLTLDPAQVAAAAATPTQN